MTILLCISEDEIEDQAGNGKQESSSGKSNVHYSERYCNCHGVLYGNAISRCPIWCGGRERDEW